MTNESALIGKLYSAPAPLWIRKEILCVCESACQWQCENLDPTTFIELWNYMQCLQYRCKIWDSQIWDFFNGKSPKFQVPNLEPILQALYMRCVNPHVTQLIPGTTHPLRAPTFENKNHWKIINIDKKISGTTHRVHHQPPNLEVQPCKL